MTTEKNTSSNSSDSSKELNAYAEDTYRPLICKEEYLKKLIELEAYTRNIRNIDFSNQIKWAIELIKFLIQFNENSKFFIRDRSYKKT